jgi:hypothetical protein
MAPGPLEWGKNASGVLIQGARALPFPTREFDTFTMKLVRGLYFLGAGRSLFPKEAVIRPFIVSRDRWPECSGTIAKLGMQERGVPPGFRFWAHVESRTNCTGLWMFLLWDAILLQAATFRNEKEAASLGEAHDGDP